MPDPELDMRGDESDRPPARMAQQPAEQECQNKSQEVFYSYYSFLTINRIMEILPEDLDFLDSQGCLDVPKRSLLDEFVRHYFLHVHPLLPIMDEEEFWKAYDETPGMDIEPDQISLLVLRAMMFLSCSFVRHSTIRALGFASCRDARIKFYRCANLLYIFDSESCPIYQAQAALMLSHSTPPANSSWLSRAIHHTTTAEQQYQGKRTKPDICAHSSVSASTSTQRGRKMLKKVRLGCIIRDRTLTLLARCPLQNAEHHFGAEACASTFLDEVFDESKQSRVYTPGIKRKQAGILASIIKLHLIATSAPNTQDSDSLRRGTGTARAAFMAVQDLKASIKSWHDSVVLEFPMSTFQGAGHVGSQNRKDRFLPHESVPLYTSLMYMYYHSARVFLCNLETLHLSTAVIAPEENWSARSALSMLDGNYKELRSALGEVAECVSTIVQLDFVQWLPLAVVPCLFLPLALDILNVQLPEDCQAKPPKLEAVAGKLSRRTKAFLDAMNTYRERYDSVDKLVDLLEQLLRLSHVDKFDEEGDEEMDGDSPILSPTGSYMLLVFLLHMSFMRARLLDLSEIPTSLQGWFGKWGGESPVRTLIRIHRRSRNRRGTGNNALTGTIDCAVGARTPGESSAGPSPAYSASGSSSSCDTLTLGTSLGRLGWPMNESVAEHELVGDLALEMDFGGELTQPLETQLLGVPNEWTEWINGGWEEDMTMPNA